MRVIVFGATGKTGRHVCQAAVDQGHRVTAFGRSVERLDQPDLDIYKGDVFDPDAVGEAVVAHDGAIVCLGSAGLRDKSTLSTGTRSVVDAMVAHYVGRLVVMSAASDSITKITRADVAACLVDQLGESEFSRQSISVTN